MNSSIARLKKKLRDIETGQQDLTDLRLTAFGDDVSMKSAMTLIGVTMERLESAMVSKRTVWTEQRN
jgi:hypothetical protein